MTANFKTIHDCRLELVSHTKWSDDQIAEFVRQSVTVSEDYLPASAARASFGKEDKTGEDKEKDFKLIRYLAEHKHLTPFEYQHVTFLVECPLFIRSQIHRHRTFSYNEISRRYTSEQLEFWIPDVCRGQHKSSKQASAGEVKELYVGFDSKKSLEAYEELYGKITPSDPVDHFKITVNAALGWYTDLIIGGVCREQARAVLPQSLLTRFYMGGNLRNWAHFIELRKDEHAQYEVRVIAEKIEAKLRELWPKSVEALLG